MIFFVPARRGSVRLPGKNTVILRGRPMIEWTFDAAKAACGFGDRVIVSTDDEAVSALARGHGFKVLSRPEHLCESGARMNDVIAHHSKSFHFQHAVVVLYPTSPLRTAAHIQAAIEYWSHSPKTDSVGLMSVSPVTHRPFGLMNINDVGLLEMNHKAGSSFYQRQGMPEQYRANGAIYILPLKAVRDGKVDAQLFTPETLPFVMDEISGHEVDEPQDLIVAEALMEWRHQVEALEREREAVPA